MVCTACGCHIVMWTWSDFIWILTILYSTKHWWIGCCIQYINYIGYNVEDRLVAEGLWTTELVKSFLVPKFLICNNSNFCSQIFLWSSLIIMNHRHFMIFEVLSCVLQETFMWQEFSWYLCSLCKLQSIRPQKFGAIQYSYITNCKWTSITATVLYDYLTVCAPINLIISSQLNMFSVLLTA